MSNNCWLTTIFFTAYLRDVLPWQKHGHVCACRDPASGDVASGLPPALVMQTVGMAGRFCAWCQTCVHLHQWPPTPSTTQPTYHRAQSTGPDVHPRLLRIAVTVTRTFSIIFGRLWQLVMGQICLEIVSRLIKDEGIGNSQEGLTEGKSFLTRLIASRMLCLALRMREEQWMLYTLTLARPLTQFSVVSL